MGVINLEKMSSVIGQIPLFLHNYHKLDHVTAGLADFGVEVVKVNDHVIARLADFGCRSRKIKWSFL